MTDSDARVSRRRRIARGRWTSRSTRSPSVVGHGVGADSEQPFLPFYSAYSTDAEQQQSAYFTTRREPRLPSSTQKRRGPRSSYIGTEVFVSLVDPTQAPFSGDLRQLSIQALVHESRSRPADAGRRRQDRFHARRRGAGREHPRRERAEPAATRRWRTARWRGARSATCRSTICRS